MADESAKKSKKAPVSPLSLGAISESGATSSTPPPKSARKEKEKEKEKEDPAPRKQLKRAQTQSESKKDKTEPTTPRSAIERKATKPSIPTGIDVSGAKKTETPMHVSDTWLSKWTGKSSDSPSSWNFVYKQDPPTEFYHPLELGLPMELQLFQTNSNAFGEIPVYVVLNGHVLRLFQGNHYTQEQATIITFNLREISVAVSADPLHGEGQQLFIVSRFHGRVFILRHAGEAKDVSMEELFTFIHININWAQKFSNISYPQSLVDDLWPSGYISQGALVLDKNPFGWGNSGKDCVLVKKEDDGNIGLYKSEEDAKPKTKVKFSVDLVINASIKGKGVMFVVEEKKKSIHMLDISGLDRVLLFFARNSIIKPKFEARVLKLVSQHGKKPSKIEYKLHPQLYHLVDSSSGSKQAPRQSVMLPPGFGLGGKTDDIISTVLDVVESINQVEDRIDKVQNLQTQIADVIDLEATRVSNLEQKIADLEGLKDAQVDYFEAIDEVMTKVEFLEAKVGFNGILSASGAPGGEGSNPDIQKSIKDANLRINDLEDSLGNFTPENSVEKRLLKLENQIKEISRGGGGGGNSSSTVDLSKEIITDFEDRIMALELRPQPKNVDSRVDQLEKQVQQLLKGGSSTGNSTSGSSPALQELEKRIAALERNQSSNSSSSSSTVEGVSSESFTRVVNRLLAAEKKLKQQEEMESTIEPLKNKVTALAQVCAKLNAQLKGGS